MVCYYQQQEAYISYGHLNLINDLRLIMTQFAYLSRIYAASAYSGFGSNAAISNKLYGLPMQLKSKIELIYGAAAAEELVQLYSMHVIYLRTLVSAMINNDQTNADKSVQQLYQNADEIAAFYSRINPFWEETQWRNRLYTYTRILIQEVFLLKASEFERDLEQFDRLMLNALLMGDYLANGIIQFLTFSNRGSGIQN